MELKRQVLLICKKVSVARVNGAHTYPANFMFITAMNPCPCGYYPSSKCRCTDYNDSAQKTQAVRKNVRGMNAPITNNATIIPTGFSSGIVGFSWPDVLQNAVIRCIALLFQEKHFRQLR